MSYKQEEIEKNLQGWGKAVKKRPWRTLGVLVILLIIGGLFTFTNAYITSLGQQLAQVEKNVEHVEIKLSAIAEALETLVIVQEVQKLESDNSILLNYDPVPQSIRIIVGPLVHFPKPNYGYSLEGRKIRIVNKDTLGQVKPRISLGGVTVEYLRKINADELP